MTIKETKLFVGQIPKDIGEDSLRSLFEQSGPVKKVSILRDAKNRKSKGCAFVYYYGEESATAAIQSMHNNFRFPNSNNFLQVSIAENTGASLPDQGDSDKTKLFVGMLSKSITVDDLQRAFGVYGELKEVHVIRGPGGSPKGCAFIKFVEKSAASQAIEQLHDTAPLGSFKNLVVKLAEDKKMLPRSYQQQQEHQYHHPHDQFMGSKMTESSHFDNVAVDREFSIFDFHRSKISNKVHNDYENSHHMQHIVQQMDLKGMNGYSDSAPPERFKHAMEGPPPASGLAYHDKYNEPTFGGSMRNTGTHTSTHTTYQYNTGRSKTRYQQMTEGFPHMGRRDRSPHPTGCEWMNLAI